MSLQVVPGEVRVTAPPGAILSVIDEFVCSRTQWLTEKLACFASIAPPAVPAEFTHGSEVSIFGEKSVLYLSEAASEVEKLIQRNHTLYVYLHRSSDLTLTVRKWLDELLLSHVKGVAEEYSRLGLIPSRIRLGRARTRWGSCSPRGVIMINRRLVHAPLKVVGYVVVHELAHLRHGNHSKKFWGVVESILGDVKEEKQWLRLQGSYLLEGE